MARASRRRRLRVNIGLQRQSATPMYPSEPRYVSQMNAAARRMSDTLLNILAQFEEASEDIMLEALEPTMEKAKRYTPVDTGNLKASAYLEVAPFRGKPRVELGFARGGSPKYAMYVHEIPYTHSPPTSWKFLERALKEDINNIYMRLGAGYREFIGNKAGA